LKVFIFVWRLIRDRLPTKANLVRRGMLHAELAECGASCGHDESTSHLFLHCDSFGPLWGHIRSWVGASGVKTNDICEHFFLFIHYTGYSRMRKSFLQLVWLLCVWVVWNECNYIIFNNTQTTIEQLLDKIKFHWLWWLKANNVSFMHDTQMWWSDPMLCPGIDWPYFCKYYVTVLFFFGWPFSTSCTKVVSQPVLIYSILMFSIFFF